jgi:hypothetical protein
VIKYRNNKTLTYLECLDDPDSDIIKWKINQNPVEIPEINENLIIIHPSIVHILNIENSGNIDNSDSSYVEICDLYDEM